MCGQSEQYLTKKKNWSKSVTLFKEFQQVNLWKVSIDDRDFILINVF